MLREGAATAELQRLQIQVALLTVDVSFSILGVDFLRANKLLVDIARNTLVDSATGNTFSLGCQAKPVLIRNNRNGTETSFGTNRNKMFVSVPNQNS